VLQFGFCPSGLDLPGGRLVDKREGGRTFPFL